MQRDIAVATTIVLIGRDLKAKLVHDLHTITEREGRTRPHPSSATVPKRERERCKRKEQKISTYVRRSVLDIFPISSPVVTRARALVVFMTCICYCLAMLKVQKGPTERGRERMQTAREPIVTTNGTCVSSHLVSLQLETGRSLHGVIIALKTEMIITSRRRTFSRPPSKRMTELRVCVLENEIHSLSRFSLSLSFTLSSSSSSAQTDTLLSIVPSDAKTRQVMRRLLTEIVSTLRKKRLCHIRVGALLEAVDSNKTKRTDRFFSLDRSHGKKRGEKRLGDAR